MASRTLDNLRSRVHDLAGARWAERAALAEGLPTTGFWRRIPDEVEALLSADAPGVIAEACTDAQAGGRRSARLQTLESELFALIDLAHQVDAGLQGHALRAARWQGRRGTSSVGWLERDLVNRRESKPRLEAEQELARRHEALADLQRRAFETTHEQLLDQGRLPHTANAPLPESEGTWTAVAVRLLADTDAMYRDVLGWWLARKTGQQLRPGAARWHDLQFALAQPAGAGLPAGQSVATLAWLVERMGLERTADGQLSVAVSPEHGAVGGWAGPVDGPLNVKAWVGVDGGGLDVGRMLQALGTGQALARVDPAAPMEEQLLGSVVPEAFGAAFASWTWDPRWLKNQRSRAPADHARVAALEALTRLRIDAARVVAWARFEEVGAAQALSESTDTLQEATGVAWEPSLAANTILGALPLPGLQRAGLLATLLEGLERRFNEDWWRNPATGGWFAGVCHGGFAGPPEDFCARHSLHPMMPEALAQRLGDALDG